MTLENVKQHPHHPGCVLSRVVYRRTGRLEVIREGQVPSREDRAWMATDLGSLGQHEAYDWAGVDPLKAGSPVRFVEGKGWVIEAGH